MTSPKKIEGLWKYQIDMLQFAEVSWKAYEGTDWAETHVTAS